MIRKFLIMFSSVCRGAFVRSLEAAKNLRRGRFLNFKPLHTTTKVIINNENKFVYSVKGTFPV